jgi:hypothetical protein
VSGTPTAAATPVSGGAVIYPNPLKDPDGSGTVRVTLPGVPQKVRLRLYTAAFRKVSDRTVEGLSGDATVDVSGKDSKGVPLAGGLYFLRLEIESGPAYILKWMVIR